jgi:hypothetical protein
MYIYMLNNIMTSYYVAFISSAIQFFFIRLVIVYVLKIICLVLLESVPVSPRGHFAVAAEAAVAVGVLNIIAAVAPVAPGIQDSVAVTGGCKVAQSLLHHALVQMNARESVVLLLSSLHGRRCGLWWWCWCSGRSLDAADFRPGRTTVCGVGVPVLADSQPLVPVSPRPGTSSAQQHHHLLHLLVQLATLSKQIVGVCCLFCDARVVVRRSPLSLECEGRY